MIDQEKVGKFIAELRKAKGLTQDDLADKLFVGREAISKWERGVCLPSHNFLIALSEEFEISINELLYGERENSKNRNLVQLISFNWFYNQLKKIKKVVLIASIIFAVCFAIVCFLLEYNSFKIFTTYVNGDNFTINKGLIIGCREKLYFKFGEIINRTNKNITDMSLYYGMDENKVKLISGNSINDLVASKSELEKLTNKTMSEVYDNLYIEIRADEITEMYKVEVRIDFRANLFSDDDKDGDPIEDEIILYSNNRLEVADIKKKFKLVNDEYIYEFKHNGKKYRCRLDGETILIKNSEIDLSFIIKSNNLKIVINNVSIFYNTETNTCETNNCEEGMDIIDMFIDNVLK